MTTKTSTIFDELHAEYCEKFNGKISRFPRTINPGDLVFRARTNYNIDSILIEVARVLDADFPDILPAAGIQTLHARTFSVYGLIDEIEKSARIDISYALSSPRAIREKATRHHLYFHKINVALDNFRICQLERISEEEEAIKRNRTRIKLIERFESLPNLNKAARSIIVN